MLSRAKTWAPAVLLLVLIGCVGAPVQEMSDARQAIAAASEAGADTGAAEILDDARALLARAEQKLEKRAYREARRAALAAQSRAVDALHAIQPGP